MPFRLMIGTTVFLLNQLGRNVVPFPFGELFSSLRGGTSSEVTYKILRKKNFSNQVLGSPFFISIVLSEFKRP